MREQPTAQELVALGEQIAEQAVHLDAAMHRLLADLRRFDEASGWYAQGFPSCAHWLSHRVGWDLGTCRERVRVARSLAELPKVDAALAEGKLSYSKARAITRVANADLEPTLLRYADVCTASQLETICRKYQAAERIAVDPKDALPRTDDRHVSTCSTASGMVCVKAWLLPDEAALLMQVIQEAAGASVSAQGASNASASPASTLSRSFNRADGLMAVVQSYARGESLHRSPTELIVTTPVSALHGQLIESTRVTSETPAETSEVDGSARGVSIPVAIVATTDTYLSPEATRRLACDCGIVEASVDDHGQPLSVGRKTRTIPAAIKRALLLRDRTCRFPGCDHRLFLDGHHVNHWADGGETSLLNLLALCSTHHSYVHERGYRILRDESGVISFLDPRGKSVVAVPRRPTPSQLGWPAIRAANHAQTTAPISADTAPVPPRGGRLDHEEAIQRLFTEQQRADGVNSTGEPWKHGPAVRSWFRPTENGPSSSDLESDEPRQPDEDTADPDYDFVAAGRRVDDLLEWSMAEFLATGIDPMAEVPAPMWPPASWRSQRAER